MFSLITAACAGQATTSTPQNIKSAREVHWLIDSKHVGDQYDIYVKLPSSYTTHSAKKYPLVVYADANIHLGTQVQQVVAELSQNQQMQEVILVGIGHQGHSASKRRRDFMPGYKETGKGNFISEAPNTGQADNFYQFLQKELLPFLTTQYRTNTERCWIGHSFSALFGVYALLKNEQLFDHYLCISPSLWVNDGNIYQIEANCFEKAKKINAQLYFCAGTREMLNLILPYVRGFDEKLAERNYQELHYKKEEFKGKNHNTVVVPALKKGLAWLLQQ